MKLAKKNAYNQLERYYPDPSQGLTDSQVVSRIESGCVNTVKTKYSKSYISIFINNIFSFFNLLGLIVAIALVWVKAPLINFFFVVIYIANIFIGITQEIRAKRCVEKLTLSNSNIIKTLRNGKLYEVSSKDIVLDDVIFLSLGEQIPTDSIILDGEIDVNESLLTGETIPIRKKKGDKILAGSFIVGGSCKAQADKVGKNNYLEQLSEKAKKYKKPDSEIMRSLHMIIKIVGGFMIPITIAHILRSFQIFQTPVKETILKNSTLIIGMIPSGMFLLTSVALAVGIIKLAKNNTLVQDLYSLEMLARVDTICFDKTGTLTDGKMVVKEVVPFGQTTESEIKDVISSMNFALQDNNPTSLALLNYFGQSAKFFATEKINFTSQKKYSAVTFENGLSYACGAPEFILDKKLYLSIKNRIDQYAVLGFRVLMLAKSKNKIEDEQLSNFSPIALIVIVDNIRQEVIETVKWFNNNDVEIKVITGDNPITASEVSKRVGIKNADKYISLEGLSETEIYTVSKDYTIFGRVTPEQKAVLVKALKQAGHTVAMTGDGINDILALKEADCAISMASGSEATRNVSHIVLLDNNFNSMPKVVLEGRRVINNIEKSSSLYLMKTLFTMILSILILFFPDRPTYPFSPAQMLTLELFVIGFPSFFISLQPNKSRVKGNFMTQVIEKSLPSAIVMVLSVIAIEFFKTILKVPESDFEIYTTMEVCCFTLTGLICLYYISAPFNLFRSVLIGVTTFIVVGVIIYALKNGDVFGIQAMPLIDYWPQILVVSVIVLAEIPIMFFVNTIFSKLHFKPLKLD